MKTFEIQKDLVPLVNDLLSRSRPITNTPYGVVLFDYGIMYSDDVMIKIQICNGVSLYTQAEVYKSGRKVQTIGPFNDIFREYEFKLGNDTHKITVQPEK